MQCSNFVRYEPRGNYFGCVRLNGKLIRRWLEAYVLTVRKPKSCDFLQDRQRSVINQGQSVMGEIIITGERVCRNPQLFGIAPK